MKSISDADHSEVLETLREALVVVDAVRRGVVLSPGALFDAELNLGAAIALMTPQTV